MADKYTLGGRRINFNANDTLGVGGQAIVVQVEDMGVRWAVKAWKSINMTQVSKVEFLLKHPPSLAVDKFLFPILPFRDERSKLIGYGMHQLPKNFREGGVLFNKGLRKVLNISTPTMLAVMNSHRSDIELLHNNGFVLGDESGRNFAFVLSSKGAKTFCYDTDAYQVAGYPCPVWTELFLCPDLYSFTKSGKPMPFTEATDWYGYATILFWSLFNTNPYQQTHPKYDNFREKAQRGIWLLDPNVEYPMPLCPHPDTVSDGLLHYFEQVFKKHNYIPVPEKELIEYSDSLIECNSCQTHYPNNRSSCPNCSVKTPAVDFSPDHKFEKLLGARGPILFAKFQAGSLYVVSREKNGYFLYIRPGKGRTVSSQIPFDVADNFRFELVGNEYLAANLIDDENVYLANVGNLSEWMATTTAIYQGNRQAMFAGTERGLFRLAGNQLLLGDVKNGYLVESREPLQLTPGQSWIWAETNGRRIVGMTRIFSMYQFELVNKSNRYEMAVSQLDQNDSLIETRVMFGGDSVCVRRIIVRKGREMIVTDVVNDFGESTFSSIHFVTKLPSQDISKSTYENGKVFWPTSGGIMIETLRTNSFETVKNTEKLVSADDKLIHLGEEVHFLVVKENKVNYLIL